MAGIAMSSTAVAEDPVRVRPSTETFSKLRKVSQEVAHTTGEHLDRAHDWIYRWMQRWLENADARFAESGAALIVVPLSSLRLGFDSTVLHRSDGVAYTPRPEFEAALRLPNLERRFKVFVTSTDLPESPGDPTGANNPIRAGVRVAPLSNFAFDVGVTVRTRPQAFAALKWSSEFTAGAKVHGYPFIKTYVDSGLGPGASGGVAVERWSGLWVVRSASYANWLRNSSATSWAQTFVAGRARAVIQERRYDRFADGRDLACGGVARISASGDRVGHTTLYETSVLFKRPLHGGWLFGYIEPVVRWERGRNWHPDAGIRLGFDALFWGLATLPAQIAGYCR